MSAKMSKEKSTKPKKAKALKMAKKEEPSVKLKTGTMSANRTAAAVKDEKEAPKSKGPSKSAKSVSKSTASQPVKVDKKQADKMKGDGDASKGADKMSRDIKNFLRNYGQQRRFYNLSNMRYSPYGTYGGMRYGGYDPYDYGGSSYGGYGGREERRSSRRGHEIRRLEDEIDRDERKLERSVRYWKEVYETERSVRYWNRRSFRRE